MNRDGKIDYAWQTKQVTSKDVMDPISTAVPGLAFGNISDALANAKKLSATEDANTRILSLDLNGDGQGDLTEYDSLDPAGQITSRTFAASQTDVFGAKEKALRPLSGTQHSRFT